MSDIKKDQTVAAKATSKSTPESATAKVTSTKTTAQVTKKTAKSISGSKTPPTAKKVTKQSLAASTPMPTPLGGLILADTPITFNEDKPVTTLKVRNTGDRPIQIGSHFHFFEVNRALEFDRAAAYGKRLNIASTTAIRFEPGDEIEVSLIPFGGTQAVYGFNNMVDGWAGENVANSERPAKKIALDNAIAHGFKNSAE